MVLRIKRAFPVELAEASAGVDSSSTPAELALRLIPAELALR